MPVVLNKPANVSEIFFEKFLKHEKNPKKLLAYSANAAQIGMFGALAESKIMKMVSKGGSKKTPAFQQLNFF